MPSPRRVRRTAGWITRYVSDDLLQHAAKADGRSSRGRTWKDPRLLLKTALLGLLAGCKGPTEVEEMTAELPKSVRKVLGIPRRIADTTLRDFLVKLDPKVLHNLLYVVGYDAWRRKALGLNGDWPFAALSMDGKYPSLPVTAPYELAQICHDETGAATHSRLRTITSTLATSPARPILGAEPIPGRTNEVGWFQQAFGNLVRIYGRLFKVVMYDAGGASRANADAVIRAGKHYLFQIADPNWVMYKTVAWLLQDRQPQAEQAEKLPENKVLVRTLTLMEARPTPTNSTIWGHARTLIKVDSTTYQDGQLIGTHTRYFVTSLRPTELAPSRWLELIVLRWGVETVHGILDGAFAEDKRPWIRANAQGSLAVQLLRRVAYTLMALYKHVTIRNENESAAPWRQHLEWVKDVLKWANPQDVDNLRPRTYAVPPALF